MEPPLDPLVGASERLLVSNPIRVIDPVHSTSPWVVLGARLQCWATIAARPQRRLDLFEVVLKKRGTKARTLVVDVAVVGQKGPGALDRLLIKDG